MLLSIDGSINTEEGVEVPGTAAPRNVMAASVLKRLVPTRIVATPDLEAAHAGLLVAPPSVEHCWKVEVHTPLVDPAGPGVQGMSTVDADTPPGRDMTRVVVVAMEACAG